MESDTRNQPSALEGHLAAQQCSENDRPSPSPHHRSTWLLTFEDQKAFWTRHATVYHMEELFMDCKAQNIETTPRNHEGRSAHYRRNIWNYDLLQSLKPGQNNEEETMEKVTELIKGVEAAFGTHETDEKKMLELVDRIRRVGLSDLFEKKIEEVLENFRLTGHQGICTTVLHFRLTRELRNPSLRGNVTTITKMVEQIKVDGGIGGSTKIEDTMELLEASHLALKEEIIFDEVRRLTEATLMENLLNYDLEGDRDEEGENRLIMRRVKHSLGLPLHRRVPWFDVKWQIESYRGTEGANTDLLELAMLNFNTLQVAHQNDLREICRWWIDLGLMQQVEFTRDRLVESFLCALGLAHELRFSPMRKSITKVVVLVLVIDDVYDLFGLIEELECFTRGVTSWDPAVIGHHPECMKVCFRALYDVTHDIALDIGGEMHRNTVLPHLKQAWADFCNALFVEAKWDNAGHVPSLGDYLDNAWISSSGPLILSHAYFYAGDVDLAAVPGLLLKYKDLMYNSSTIIRLCNDLATWKAERDRGDSPSSVVCHMQEANVSEYSAQKYIQGLVDKAWKNVNELCIVTDGEQSLGSSRFIVDVTVNAARVSHMLYRYGDGFGNQDREIRAQILSTIFEPVTIEVDGVE